MYWVVDITRATFNSERAVLEGFAQIVDPADRAMVIHRREQALPPLDHLTYELRCVPEDVATDEDKFLEWASAQVQEAGSHGDELAITSFWVPFESIASAYDSGRAKYYKLGQLMRKVPDGRASKWDATFMPEQEAVRFLVKAVAGSQSQYGHKVRITDLRSRLEILDPRFHKNRGGFAATTGFISLLLELGRKRGLIEVDSQPESPQQIWVGLTSDGSRFAGTSRSSGGHGETTPKTSSGLPSVGTEEIETRSQVIMSTLKGARMGPFQQVRLDIINEIKKVACEGKYPPLMVVDEAIKRVRSDDSLPRSKDFASLPWPRIRSFMRKLLSNSPVLMSDGDLISGGWSESGDRLVTGIAQKADLELDGELIVTLVKHGLKVTLDDEPDLAGALYNSREDQYLQLVDHVIGHLIARTVLGEDPTTGHLVLP